MSNPYQSPKASDPHAHPTAANQGDATGGVIPYKNPKALLAYYFGIGTMLCCITPLPLGLIPLVLGIMGLRDRAQSHHQGFRSRLDWHCPGRAVGDVFNLVCRVFSNCGDQRRI